MTAQQGTFRIDSQGKPYIYFPGDDEEPEKTEFTETKVVKSAQSAKDTPSRRLSALGIAKYTNELLLVLDDIADYRQVSRLSEVVKDTPEQSWPGNIKYIMERYWRNNPRLVENISLIRYNHCVKGIEALNVLCQEIGAEPIDDIDGFIELLSDKHRRNAYRRYLKKDPSKLMSISALEQKYRKFNPKRFS